MFELVLFLIASISSCCQCLTYEQEVELYSIQNSFEEINYHLFDSVQSDDVEPNMREAKRWFNEEVGTSSDEKLRKALKLFISMDTMQMCTKESSEILESNDLLIGYKARQIGKGTIVLTRVDEIIASYEIRHARECLPKYAKILRERYEQVGESTTDMAHKIVHILVHSNKPSESYGRLVYKGIEELAENDPDKKYLKRVPNKREGIKELNETKLRELYDKYVVEPCTKLVGMNDNGWYEAYLFDDEWVRVDFRDALLDGYGKRYRVCKVLIGKDREKLYSIFREEAISK